MTTVSEGRVTVSRVSTGDGFDYAAIEVRLLGIPLPLVKIKLSIKAFGRVMLNEGRVPCTIEYNDPYSSNEDSG